ncbi:dipeptidase [Neoroseomonas soli]|uniref:Membrane dipeptidase n=1 Tax=Neoroseomonas soli TaxID=1081025 RepID=A0A9X9WZ49_9PROT|nr:dipeptidase [Neoroseomonas soli]MBR0672428.1 membrane dipeptidase [Neoroseomonas soli]
MTTTAAAIHAATLTLDTHIDIRWPDPPDATGETDRRVDFPKMLRGGLKAAVFIAYTPQGRRDEEGLITASTRAEAMLRHIRGRADDAARRFCATAGELEAAHQAGALAVLSAVENANAMARDLSKLTLWRDLGAIYVTITHDGHNDLADAARPKPDLGDAEAEHGGLSALGRAAIREMNRVGLLVDVSHSAKSSMMQAAELSRVPIVATHSCCRALCDHPRNLDDEQLDMLRAVGGLVQITALDAFLRPAPQGGKSPATVKDMADHVDYAVKRIGIDHVGLSSDFDGGGGIPGWKDASETLNLTTELHHRGYGARELDLLWSGNFRRLMRLARKAAQ